MQIQALIQRVILKYPLLSENTNWGERGLFYNPNEQFNKGAYVLTFKEKDGKNDSASRLNGENRYRLNLKISKLTFIHLFKTIPKRPAAGGVIEGWYDFTAVDEVMPHPVYGWMTWVCIINPTLKTIESMEGNGLFDKAYKAAVINIERKCKVARKKSDF